MAIPLSRPSSAYFPHPRRSRPGAENLFTAGIAEHGGIFHILCTPYVLCGEISAAF